MTNQTLVTTQILDVTDCCPGKGVPESHARI